MEADTDRQPMTPRVEDKGPERDNLASLVTRSRASADHRSVVALVTGGNRGIGLEVCRQLARAGLHVILGSRDPGRGRNAARALAAEGLDVSVEELDVADPESVRACARRLEEAGLTVDVLINNAAVYPTAGILQVDEATAEEALQINLLGALRTCQAFVPGMVARGYGRVVNVSSGGGSLTEDVPGPGAYGLSKAGLNALTRMVANSVRGDVKVNAACPGWVATDMGGAAAPRSLEQGADTIVWLATLPEDGPTDGFFRDRRPIPW
jgi:NAD(P)-dependent dehydrogenase (short-subunit alcohol dehydrogenase family)